jgi:hypothetical protein
VGFTTVATAPRPTMLVVADLSTTDVGKVGELVARGADALLAPDESAEAVLKAVGTGPVPVGVRLVKGDRGRVKALREAGADFVVLGEESAASALMEDQLSYILEVAEAPTDSDLRALEALPVDALLAPPVDGALTIRRSIVLRRFVAFARRPLMLPIPPDTDTADLEALRELNVLLLLVPAAAAADVRERVAALPPRRRRREESSVGIPIGVQIRPRVEEAGEDEDED